MRSMSASTSAGAGWPTPGPAKVAKAATSPRASRRAPAALASALAVGARVAAALVVPRAPRSRIGHRRGRDGLGGFAVGDLLHVPPCRDEDGDRRPVADVLRHGTRRSRGGPAPPCVRSADQYSETTGGTGI